MKWCVCVCVCTRVLAYMYVRACTRVCVCVCARARACVRAWRVALVCVSDGGMCAPAPSKTTIIGLSSVLCLFLCVFPAPPPPPFPSVTSKEEFLISQLNPDTCFRNGRKIKMLVGPWYIILLLSLFTLLALVYTY